MTDKQIITAVSHGLKPLLRGQPQIAALRSAIISLQSVERVVLEFDPSTPPELVDYLAVTSLRAGTRAAQGALLGLLLGLLFKRPGFGASMGALAGAAVGTAEGVRRVQTGWRIRAGWTAYGEPWAQVERYTLGTG